MAGAPTKVRFVRCPRCLKILPEDPELRVYECGGCGAVLQAKNHKNGSSRSLEKSTKKDQLEPDLEDVNVPSAGQLENHHDTKECPPHSNAKEHLNSTDCSIEASGRRNSLNGASSGISECFSDLTAEEQLKHDSEGVKSTSLDQTENNPDTEECSSDPNAKEQLESMDCNIKPSGSRNFLSGVSSGELECPSDLNKEEELENQLEHDSEDVNSTCSNQIEKLCNTKASSSNMNVKGKTESKECSVTSSGCRNFLTAVYSGDSECFSGLNEEEKVEPKDCNTEPSMSNFLDVVSSSNSLDLDSKNEQIESTEYSIKQSRSRSVLQEVSSSDHEKEGKSPEAEAEAGRNAQPDENDISQSSDGKPSCRGRNSSSPEAEAGRNTQPDENDISQSFDGEPSCRGGNSSFPAKRQLDECHNNCNSALSPNKVGYLDPCPPISIEKMNFTPLNTQLQQSHGIPYHDPDLDHKKSMGTVVVSETIDSGDISEELAGTPRNISKSSTARSSHAYYGSVSSRDGSDDQEPLNLPKRSWLNSQAISDFTSEEIPRREDGLMYKKIVNDPEVQHQLRKFFSMPLDEKDGLAAKEGLKWEGSGIQAQRQAGSPDSDGRYPIKNRMSSIDDDFFSRDSSQRGFPTVFENGSPLNYGHEEFSSRTSATNSSKLDYFEQMELLRKVNELRDQLSRSYNQREMENGRFPTRGTQQGKQQQLYYRYGQPEPEIPHWYDANHHMHPHVPFRTSKNGCQKCDVSQMHFSGQVTTCINHVDYSSDQCCQEDWQCQTQFPPSCTCCIKGPSRGHSGQMFYGPYSSGSSTQQKYMDPYLSLQGSRTHSQELGHVVHDIQKLHHRNRPQPPKRHCRPIAGGAPFIMCYRCCKLLQLPEDFISQKRIHRLQCSACSQVLKFSLQNRIHVIPYYPNPAVPPPSEVDNTSDYPQGDRVSYSEDCKTSMASSINSEANMKSKNSQVLKQSGNNCENSIEESESGRSSLNVAKLESSTREGEVVPKPSSSALHWLMGYSSPSKIIHG